jgi:membrane protein required for colicin V production
VPKYNHQVKMTNLNWVFCSILFVSVCIGCYRGWLPQALSMLGFLLAMLGIIIIGPEIAKWLPLTESIEHYRHDIGAFTAFVTTLYVVHLGSKLHRHIYTHNGVQPAHRTLGAVFGLFSGLFLSLGLGLLIEFNELRTQSWWHGSIEKNLIVSVLELISKLFEISGWSYLRHFLAR